ncbi:MAG: serine/threonine protein kinase [Chloroflexota bacterium]
MIPQRIGRYELIAELGRGGMATVYRAHDPRFKRDVAIKLMPAQFLSDPTFRARFEREAQMIAALEHPAIVPVYDFGDEDSQPYLVMRYMPGGSLADKLAHGPLSPMDASHIIARLSSALDQVHTHGIVHRDLKPANVLFDQYGEAYLSDFGIARLSEATTNLTGDAIVGTPAYMSPEQARGETDIDGRSDLYALGVMLFQMLTGKQPYEAPTPIAVAMKHITDPVPRLTEVRPDMPPTYDRVIESAMAKNRQDRFPTGGDLFSALEKAMLEAGQMLAASGSEYQATAPYGPPLSGRPVSRPITPPPGARPPSSSGSARPATPAPRAASAVSMGGAAKPHRGVPVWAWLVIGVLGLGLLCGVAFLGWAFLDGLSASTAPTAVSIALPTASPEAYVIQGDTPLPLATATERPAAVVFESGDTILEDDFSDPDSGWPTYEGDDGFFRYQAEAYRIYVDIPNARLESVLAQNWADVYITAEASKVGGADDNLVGLVCRYQDRNNFYLFVISSDGYYAVGKVVDGNYDLSDGKMLPSSAIKKGKSTNTLEASCYQDAFTFWVNGSELAYVEDHTFSSGGVGLLAGTYATAGTDILFDDFGIYVP